MDKIWIVTIYSKRDLYNTGVAIIDKFFKTKEDAIRFCESRFTEEEIEKHYKMLKRSLIEWYEYSDEKYIYEIKELESE